MSYILDALNKAEQARRQNEGNMQNQPLTQSAAVAAKRGNRLLIPLLLISAGLILYALAPRQQQEKAGQSGNLPARPAQSPKTEPPRIEASKEKPVQQTPVTTAVLDHLPTIMELPQPILERLPEIKISAHTYSQSPERRMVIINNKVLHENRMIAGQLKLKNIRPQGVELEFDGTLFSMTPYDSWPY